MKYLDHQFMWGLIIFIFLACCFLIYLLMTGSYTSPLCLDAMLIQNLGIGQS